MPPFFEKLRLSLIANNSRFLILPDWRFPNIGSRVLALTEHPIADDWQIRFGHPLLLLETLVDPRRFVPSTPALQPCFYHGKSTIELLDSQNAASHDQEHHSARGAE